MQWAKRAGCKVAGTAGGADKIQMLTDLGCDVPVNYRFVLP